MKKSIFNEFSISNIAEKNFHDNTLFYESEHIEKKRDNVYYDYLEKDPCNEDRWNIVEEKPFCGDDNGGGGCCMCCLIIVCCFDRDTEIIK